RLDSTQRLRALWALHVTKGLDEKMILELLDDKDSWVRAWTIQLACENGQPSAPILAKFAPLATSDPSPVVRLYLASACQRLSIDARFPIVEALAKHPEDATDHNLPMMLWYATEPAVAANPARGANLLGTMQIPRLQEFIARRLASFPQ